MLYGKYAIRYGIPTYTRVSFVDIVDSRSIGDAYSSKLSKRHVGRATNTQAQA